MLVAFAVCRDKDRIGQSVIRTQPSEESFHSRWMCIHLEGRAENGMKAGASNPTGWKMKRKKQKQRCTCDALLLHHRGGYSLERGISGSFFFCARNFKALQITFTCHSCWIRASTRQKRIFLPSFVQSCPVILVNRNRSSYLRSPGIISYFVSVFGTSVFIKRFSIKILLLDHMQEYSQE